MSGRLLLAAVLRVHPWCDPWHSFLPFGGQSSPAVWVDLTLLTPSRIDGTPGCFRLSAVVAGSAVNAGVQISLSPCARLLSVCPGGATSGSRGGSPRSRRAVCRGRCSAVVPSATHKAPSFSGMRYVGTRGAKAQEQSRDPPPHEAVRSPEHQLSGAERGLPIKRRPARGAHSPGLSRSSRAPMSPPSLHRPGPSNARTCSPFLCPGHCPGARLGTWSLPPPVPPGHPSSASTVDAAKRQPHRLPSGPRLALRAC